MSIATVADLHANKYPPFDFLKSLSLKSPGVWASTFYATGRPAAATAPSPGLAGAALTSYAGQIPIPCSTPLVARLEGTFPYLWYGGQIMLADRLWHNSGITVTSAVAQTINSVAWPARDVNGATDGAGVMVGLEVSTQTGVGAPTVTLSYTNQDGTPGQTATLSWLSQNTVGTIIPFDLAAGDYGVQSIQTYTQSGTMTSGAVHLVAYRPICAVQIENDTGTFAADGVSVGAPWAGSVPFVMLVTGGVSGGGWSSSTQVVSGNVTFTEES